MYDSIVQQLLFLRDLIEGKEKDRAKLWDMTFGMYAGKEFDHSDELFLKGCQMPRLLWIKSAEVKRLGCRMRVDTNYNKKTKPHEEIP